MAGATNGIAVTGSYVYVAASLNGLQILKLNPLAPPVAAALNIRLIGGDGFEVFWPRSEAGFKLEQSSNLSSNRWQRLESVPVETEDEYHMAIESSERLFFRLVRDDRESPHTNISGPE